MHILIVSKNYHPKAAAAEIQVRRIVNTLLEYGENVITLVTEGFNNKIEFKNKLEVINIEPVYTKFPFLERLIERLLCSLVCLRRNHFIITSALIVKRILIEKQIDLLLTISTPFDAHIVGFETKRENPKLKWVTLFTDMWPVGLLPKPYNRKKLFGKLELKLMKSVVENCDGFITPTDYTINLLKKYFHIKARFCNIPHCSDLLSVTTSNQISGYLIHSGSLQKERIRDELVKAVAELARENSDFKGLIHLGYYDPKLKELVDKENCKSFFLINRIPEFVAIRIQSLFEIGIIIEAPFKEANPFMPSKISDSIQLNKRLVAITPKESFLRDFANNNGGIFCCSYERSEIKAAITAALQSDRKISREAIEYFHPFNIAFQYNSFFKQIVEL